MHVVTLGCCSGRLQHMEALLVVVYAIVTAVYLDGNPTQTHESSHRQNGSGAAATSTQGLEGTSVYGQRIVLVGGP
jgi:hypothetical protein